MAISAGTVAAALTLDTTKFEGALQQSRTMVETFGKSNLTVTEKLGLVGKTMQSVGTIATVGLTVPLVAAGTQATRTFMDFDDSMRQVRATMNASEEDTRKLTDAAKKYGAETSFSASQSAEALNYLALAGYDADQAIGALPTVLRLAQAGNMDLAYASDLVTDSMSALGLEMGNLEGFTDQMAVTAQKSNTSISQLGQGILTVGGLAKNLKGGTVELNAELGILADNGIKGAEGGTHLRNVLLSLMNPTEEGAALLAQYTQGVYDAEGHMRSLDDILGELKASMAAMKSDEERNNAINTIFNKTDIAAVNALLSGTGERFQQLSGYIRDSQGAAEQMAATMEGGIGGAFRSLKSATEAVGIELGEVLAPHVQGMAEWVAGLARGFAGLNDSTKQTIVLSAGVAAAAGPVMNVLGKLATLVTRISGGAHVLGGLLTGPAALPVLGGAAAVAILQACEAADDGMGRLRRRLKEEVDEDQLSQFMEGYELGKKQITQEVDVSVDLHTDLSEKTVTLYDDIYQWLTDGMPDTTAQAAEMNERVNAYYDSLLAQIDLSESQEQAKLQAQLDAGLIDMETFTEKADGVTSKANESREAVEALREETLSYIENYTGAPTAVVEQAYDEIEGLEERAQGLVDKVAAANQEMLNYAQKYEELVSSGQTQDQRAIGYAVASVSIDTATQKDEIAAKAAAEVEEIQKTVDEAVAQAMAEGDPEGAAKITENGANRVREIEEKAAADMKAADQEGAKRMQDVFSGIAQAFPEEWAKLEDMFLQANIDDALKQWQSGETLKFESLPENVQAALQASFGDVLDEIDQFEFSDAEVSQKLGNALQELFTGFDQTEAMSMLDPGSGLGAAIQGILETGVMDGIESIDLSSPESMLRLLMGDLVREGTSGADAEFESAGTASASLFTAAAAAAITQGKGQVTGATRNMGAGAASAARSGGLNSATGSNMAGNMVSGVVSGFRAGLARVQAAAREMAEAAVAGAKARLSIQSPSKVFAEIGRNIGAGMALGIDDSAIDVRAAVRRLTDTDDLTAGGAGARRGEAAPAAVGPTYNFTFNDAKIRDRDEARNLLRETLRLRQQDQRARGV